MLQVTDSPSVANHFSMFRTNILNNHVLNTEVLQLNLLTIIFLLLIETDHSPDSEHVCEALSEPRRVVELDDSDLIGDHDIRCFTRCCVGLCCVTVSSVVIMSFYVMLFYVKFCSCFMFIISIYLSSPFSVLSAAAPDTPLCLQHTVLGSSSCQYIKYLFLSCLLQKLTFSSVFFFIHFFFFLHYFYFALLFLLISFRFCSHTTILFLPELS
jgi:hypothetical protein